MQSGNLKRTGDLMAPGLKGWQHQQRSQKIRLRGGKQAHFRTHGIWVGSGTFKRDSHPDVICIPYLLGFSHQMLVLQQKSSPRLRKYSKKTTGDIIPGSYTFCSSCHSCQASLAPLGPLPSIHSMSRMCLTSIAQGEWRTTYEETSRPGDTALLQKAQRITHLQEDFPECPLRPNWFSNLKSTFACMCWRTGGFSNKRVGPESFLS